MVAWSDHEYRAAQEVGPRMQSVQQPSRVRTANGLASAEGNEADTGADTFTRPGLDGRSRPALATAKRSRPNHTFGEAETVWEERERERDARAEMERDDRDPAYGASSPYDDAVGREY